MKIRRLVSAASAIGIACLVAAGQTPVVINDPISKSTEWKLSAAEQAIMDRSVLPPARRKLASDACEETIEVSGILQGSFTRPGARQTLFFYQFCQTGNGLGTVGVAVIEDGEVIANFVCADSGWTVDAKKLPDINQNGLNEFALYYSGGMHQGEGGTGVDMFEISGRKMREIGWFQAESFTADGPVKGYKVMAKPGKTPTFSREEYVQNAAGKWRKVGRPVALKIMAVTGSFEAVK
ncbi:MAG: hypothetical protein ABIV21_09090 [Pyrinomonadaceae bacterium]